MNRLEKILLYLDGKMTKEELLEFKEQLKIDPDLMEELDIHRLTDEATRRDDELGFREKLANTYEEYENKRSDKPAGKVRPVYARYSFAAVAAFAAGILLTLFFLHPFELDENEIFDKYYKPFNSDFTSRSLSDEHDAYPRKAIKLYLEGDYIHSLQEFDAFFSGGQSPSVVSDFYIGLVSIENEDYNLAINSFESILGQDFSYLHEHAQWYLSLVYLKTGKPHLAKQNLMDLKLQMSVYSKDAKKILQKYPV
ncbi:MAG: hypothetical protein K9H49_00235 [Bacteroidales bacterium]|nr:hypothetical protein [Bacteroidales bacterium]MCF8389281.1 hypothetical protein [Bacteroidales bacterium]